MFWYGLLVIISLLAFFLNLIAIIVLLYLPYRRLNRIKMGSIMRLRLRLGRLSLRLGHTFLESRTERMLLFVDDQLHLIELDRCGVQLLHLLELGLLGDVVHHLLRKYQIRL